MRLRTGGEEQEVTLKDEFSVRLAPDRDLVGRNYWSLAARD